MNRQTKHLLALAGVLAVGLGAYAALRGWNAGEEEREAAQADYVLQLSDVTALSFDSGDGPLSFTPVSYTHLDVYKRQGRIRWRRLRVAAQVRAMFPQFWGISGSTNTMFSNGSTSRCG